MLVLSASCTGVADEEVVGRRLQAMRSKFRIEGGRRLYTAKPGAEPWTKPRRRVSSSSSMDSSCHTAVSAESASTTGASSSKVASVNFPLSLYLETYSCWGTSLRHSKVDNARRLAKTHWGLESNLGFVKMAPPPQQPQAVSPELLELKRLVEGQAILMEGLRRQLSEVSAKAEAESKRKMAKAAAV